MRWRTRPQPRGRGCHQIVTDAASEVAPGGLDSERYARKKAVPMIASGAFVIFGVLLMAQGLGLL